MVDLDKEIKRIDEGGEAWDENDEVVQLDIEKPVDKVISIRISTDKWEELKKEASELGVGPTTLARMWILERLRERVRSGI